MDFMNLQFARFGERRSRVPGGAVRAFALLSVLLLALFCAGCDQEAERTPEPVPAPVNETENPAPELQPTDYREAYAAYLEQLAAVREDILGYDWQKGMAFNEELYEAVPAGLTAPVALADVWGDETPELLYCTALSSDGFRYAASLHVCTWEKTGLRELLDGVTLDEQVGGGMNYRLFRTGDKELWMYGAYYSEGMWEKYIRFSAAGAMEPAETWEHSIFPVEDDAAEQGWREEETWYRDGEVSTQTAYEAAIPSEAAQAQDLLMRNAYYYEYMSDVEASAEKARYPENGAALSYDGAVAFLRGELGMEAPAVNETAFFSSLPDFTFCSGVGAWETDLHVEADGSFQGTFHDSNMGEDGEDYPNGTVYVSSFSGRFGSVKRLDDFRYSMELLELHTEEPEGKEWIEDGIRFVTSAPYGLEHAKEMEVYLPGAWLRSLPPAFVSWVSMPLSWSESERPVLLPFYGLYNIADEEGFFGDAGTG